MRRHTLPGPSALTVLDAELFDDGDDVVVDYLVAQVRQHGAIALHPDGDRITHYDPVPLHGDNGRRREPKPLPPLPLHKGPTKDERRAAEQMITWLDSVAPRPFTIEERQAAHRPPKNLRPRNWEEPIVEWLPADFQWMLDGNQRISQAAIEQFWIEHRARTFAFRTIRVQPQQQERL